MPYLNKIQNQYLIVFISIFIFKLWEVVNGIYLLPIVHAESITYRMLEANEASRLVAFVESVYGSSYPSDVFTCEKTIASLINEGLLHSSIAIDAGNRIVGHIAAMLDKKSDITADCVCNMVHPDVRGSDVASQVSLPLADFYSKKNIAGLHLYAVTMHTISQKKILAGGGGVTGLLLGDWPSDISVEGFVEAAHRKQRRVGRRGFSHQAAFFSSGSCSASCW